MGGIGSLLVIMSVLFWCGMLVVGDVCEGRAFEYIDYMGIFYLSNIFYEFKVILKDLLYLKRKINEIN